MQVHAAAGWLLHTGVKLRVTAQTGAGLRLLYTAILEGLMRLGSGSGARIGLGLLDIASLCVYVCFFVCYLVILHMCCIVVTRWGGPDGIEA